MTIQSSDNQVAHVVYFKSFEAIQLLCVKNRFICYFTVNLPLCWSSEICHDDASFHQCHQMRFAWCRIREDFLWIMTSISVGSSCIIRLQKTCNMAHKSHYRTHFCAFWSLTDMNWIFEVTSKKKIKKRQTFSCYVSQEKEVTMRENTNERIVILDCSIKKVQRVTFLLPFA